VQLHITSLPGGRLGDEARRFVDWLASSTTATRTALGTERSAASAPF
jgi:hypothetical protein